MKKCHPLVTQLRFTRSEFLRAIKGISEKDAQTRILPMNSISWNVGHLAWQEQHYFLYFAQDKLLLPAVQEQFAYGCKASTPPLKSVLKSWLTITKAVDPWLDAVTTVKLLSPVYREGKKTRYIYGNLIQRMIYHYWYHTGENMAIRQKLGHKKLPIFVGNIDTRAPYIPDNA